MIRRNFWQSLKKFCTQGSEPPYIFENLIKSNICLTRPCLQQVSLTWSCDPIEKQHLVSGQLKKKNMWPRWALNLSPQYGHVILASGYLVWQVSTDHNRTPNIKEGRYKQRLHVSVNLLAGVWPLSCATLSPATTTSPSCAPRATPLYNYERINSWVSISFLYV